MRMARLGNGQRPHGGDLITQQSWETVLKHLEIGKPLWLEDSTPR